jgi:hypothetical protein
VVNNSINSVLISASHSTPNILSTASISTQPASTATTILASKTTRPPCLPFECSTNVSI